MGWKDRAERTQDDIQEPVASGWKNRAERIPDSKGFDFGEALQTAQDFGAGVKEGIPGYGVVEKAAAGAVAGAQEIGEAFGYEKPKDFSDRYNEIMAEYERQEEARRERSPVADFTGNMAGAFMAPMPGGAGISGIAARTGINVGDAMTRARSPEEAARSGVLAGGVSAGMEGLGVVGRGAAKAGKMLLPGTKETLPIVNRGVANLSKLVPSQGSKADHIYRALSDVDERRALKDYDLQAEMPELKQRLTESSKNIDETVGNRFRELEEQSLKGDIGDADIASEVMEEIENLQRKVFETGKEFYNADARKSLVRAEKSMMGYDPQEPAESFGKFFNDLPDPDKAASLRVLRARRAVDDLTRNKDFPSLSIYERNLFLELRNLLDDTLKNKLSGKETRREADKLYSSYKEASKNLYDPFTSKLPSGKREIDIQKLESEIKSQTTRGDKLDYRIEAMEQFLNKAEPQIGAMPEVRDALKAVKDLRQMAENNAFMNTMNYAGGGPTSQAVNTAAQLMAGTATGGWSLLALPATNPVGWARIVDIMADMSGTKWGKLLGDSSRRGSESLALTHYMLMQQDPIYQQEFKARMMQKKNQSESAPQPSIESYGR